MKLTLGQSDHPFGYIADTMDRGVLWVRRARGSAEEGKQVPAIEAPGRHAPANDAEEAVPHP